MTTDIRRTTPEPDPHDWLDALLDESASTTRYLDDAGFTSRLLAALPPCRAARRYDWIVPLATVLGCGIGAYSLYTAGVFPREVTSLLELKGITLHSLWMVLVPVVGLYWLAFGAAWQED